MAVHTGLRQGELLGLIWTDVDLGSGELSVRRSLKVTENGLGFGPPKNKASRRSVPLNKTALAALKAHRKRQNEERLRTPEWSDNDLVFPNRVGKPMDQQPLPPRVQSATEGGGARGARVHVPQPAPHVRHGPLQEGRAPEDSAVPTRSREHRADDGHLLAPAGGHRRRRRWGARRGLRLDGLQYGCSKRGPADTRASRFTCK